jgi:hypothetical protein
MVRVAFFADFVFAIFISSSVQPGVPVTTTMYADGARPYRAKIQEAPGTAVPGDHWPTI